MSLLAAGLIATSSTLVVALPSSAAPPQNAAQEQRHVPAKKPSKIAHVVREVARDAAAERSRGRSAARASNSMVRSTAEGLIEVTVHGKLPIDAARKGALRALGAKITAEPRNPAGIEMPRAFVVQALVPHDQLDKAARLGWVTAITPVERTQPDTHPTNPINSEGVAFHNADDVQDRGIDGTGVDVGVVSDGVQNLAAAQAQNELPDVTVLDAGSNDEGTAMLEIVHDMAPGAGLLFDGTGGGTVNHVNSLNNLVANDADVVTEDIPFDAEPAFQQGFVAAAGEAIASSGVPIHSSAGNQARRHAARVPATGTGAGPDGSSGPYSGCTYDPANAVAIAPGGDTTFDVSLGNNARFTLQWSEPRAVFPSAGQGGFTDIDMFVMDASLTQCLGESIAVQGDGEGDTIEQVVVGGMNGTNAKIVVEVFGTSSAVAAPLIDLRWRGAGATDTPTRAGSLNPDANYTGLASSSAALNAQAAGALENFSSGGPAQLVTTTQCAGGGAGPCTGVAGSSTTATAPTWSAADNVSVSGVGGFGSPFAGTSAAAPHAAGCDALLRDELNDAAAPPATTNALLASTAVDIDSPGVDNNTGAGQLDCLQAINDPPVADADGPYATDEGTNVTLDATGSSDPDVGDSLTFEWDLDGDGQFDDSTSATPTFDAVGQDGVFPVAVRVTDTAGDSDVDTSTVTVNNVAPTVGAIVTDAPKDEANAVSISGTISDPGWLDPLSATIDFDDGAGPQPLAGVLENVRPDATLTYDLTHLYGDNGTFTIEVCAADDDTTGNCNSTMVVIDNIDPMAAIDASGEQTYDGVSATVLPAGEDLTLGVTGTDPGSDDLEFEWLWGDGGSDTQTSLVNPPLPDPAKSPSVQPRDVTLDATHAYTDACLYELTANLTDDDGGVGSDTASVVVTGNADTSKGHGWWYAQYRPQPPNDFSEATLQCYLDIAVFFSLVFNDPLDRADGERILRAPAKAPETVQFDEKALAAWLNVANGALTFDTLVDTDGDGTLDTTFGDAMLTAETVRTDPAATPAELRAQRDILERIILRDE
ncbi:MAG: hypothetical protein GEU97_17880 [Actinophytocola sp.]|nr:hypothetical protein [Actinophytocola sp.]